jgi:hypothetical protein
LRFDGIELLTDGRYLLIESIEALLELFDAVVDVCWWLLRKERRGCEKRHKEYGAVTMTDHGFPPAWRANEAKAAYAEGGAREERPNKATSETGASAGAASV